MSQQIQITGVTGTGSYQIQVCNITKTYWTTISDTDTFDGYTLQQVVKALRTLRVLQYKKINNIIINKKLWEFLLDQQ